MEYNAAIAPTDHDKREWSRLAQDAYSTGHNDIGNKYSGLSAMDRGTRIDLAIFDHYQSLYRVWLIDGIRAMSRQFDYI